MPAAPTLTRDEEELVEEDVEMSAEAVDEESEFWRSRAK